MIDIDKDLDIGKDIDINVEKHVDLCSVSGGKCEPKNVRERVEL